MTPSPQLLSASRAIATMADAAATLQSRAGWFTRSADAATGREARAARTAALADARAAVHLLDGSGLDTAAEHARSAVRTLEFDPHSETFRAAHHFRRQGTTLAAQVEQIRAAAPDLLDAEQLRAAPAPDLGRAVTAPLEHVTTAEWRHLLDELGSTAPDPPLALVGPDSRSTLTRHLPALVAGTTGDLHLPWVENARHVARVDLQHTDDVAQRLAAIVKTPADQLAPRDYTDLVAITGSRHRAKLGVIASTDSALSFQRRAELAATGDEQARHDVLRVLRAGRADGLTRARAQREAVQIAGRAPERITPKHWGQLAALMDSHHGRTLGIGDTGHWLRTAQRFDDLATGAAAPEPADFAMLATWHRLTTSQPARLQIAHQPAVHASTIAGATAVPVPRATT